MKSSAEDVHRLCGEALAACKSLDIALIGMQSRLDLDMPVDATMVIIEADLQSLNERVESLRGEFNPCEPR